MIVAHPDDETLWAGGTILKHPEWHWETWSAAMYLYAALCVERGEVVFLDKKYLKEGWKS